MATLTLFPFCGSYKYQFSEPRLPHTPGTPGTGPLHVLIQAHFWIRETMQRNLLKQRHESKFKKGLKVFSCPPGGETRTPGKLTGGQEHSLLGVSWTLPRQGERIMPGRLTGVGAQPPQCFLHSAASEIPAEAEHIMRTETGTPQRKGTRGQKSIRSLPRSAGMKPL